MYNLVNSDLPMVSVITPSLNSMPYLEANIKSVLNQKYPKIEHIIIDGCSNDGTLELLRSYPHLIWISEKDSGQSQAINKGYKKSKGEIIGWLNSDDIYNPGAVLKAIQFFKTNPDVDVVYTDINIINSEGKIIGFSKADDFSIERMLTYNMIKQPSLFMRRKVFECLGGLDENLHYVMDREFMLRAGCSNFIIQYIKNEIFANFRFIQGTKSFESAVKFNKEWKIVVERNINHPSFSILNERKKEYILKTVKSGSYVAQMIESLEDKKRILLLKNFIKSIKLKPKLLINPGIWKFLIFGLLGISYNKLHKFQ